MRKSSYTRKQTVKKVKIMRTKTVLLSALLGTLGSVSVMAQSNVYSLNAVGYVNVICYPGYNLISCPLIASPDNTLNTLINNGSQLYTGDSVYTYIPSTSGYNFDTAETIGGRTGTANTNGWEFNGTLALNPGTGAWFFNNALTNITLQFVGQVPTSLNYNMTNTIVGPGFNLVSPILPIAGDLITNAFTTTNSGVTITNSGLGNLTNYVIGDTMYTYFPTNVGTSNSVYQTFQSATGRGQGGYGYTEPGAGGNGTGDWDSPGDPTLTYVGEGFWYFTTATQINWVENYSVSQ
jgi:hypothetical protein